jgi:hypothetical protein
MTEYFAFLRAKAGGSAATIRPKRRSMYGERESDGDRAIDDSWLEVDRPVREGEAPRIALDRRFVSANETQDLGNAKSGAGDEPAPPKSAAAKERAGGDPGGAAEPTVAALRTSPPGVRDNRAAIVEIAQVGAKTRSLARLGEAVGRRVGKPVVGVERIGSERDQSGDRAASAGGVRRHQLDVVTGPGSPERAAGVKTMDPLPSVEPAYGSNAGGRPSAAQAAQRIARPVGAELYSAKSATLSPEARRAPTVPDVRGHSDRGLSERVEKSPEHSGELLPPALGPKPPAGAFEPVLETAKRSSEVKGAVATLVPPVSIRAASPSTPMSASAPRPLGPVKSHDAGGSNADQPVHVTIGKIEIREQRAMPPPPKRASQGRLSLRAYLDRRMRGPARE